MEGSTVKKLLVLSTLSALLLLPGAARAQLTPSVPSPIHCGLGAGPSLLTGSSGDVFRSGFHGRAFVKLTLPGLPMALRLDGSYQHFKATLPGLDLVTIDGTASLLGGTADLQYDLIGIGPVRPYVFAGVGAYSLKPSNGSSTSRFGINGGGGVNLNFAGINVFGEARLENLFSKGDSDKIQVVPITVGIMF
jgi:hypothetical protein